jgi:putative membrane protein
MMWHYSRFGGGFPDLWIWILFGFGAVMLFAFLSSHSHESRTENDREDSALQILKQRYAKGEIDKKQFEEMKKTIE